MNRWPPVWSVTSAGEASAKLTLTVTLQVSSGWQEGRRKTENQDSGLKLKKEN